MTLRAVPSPTSASHQPPHDDEAEQAVLGVLLVEPAGLAKVQDFLEPRMFFSGRHQMIFAAVQELAAKGVSADAVTVRTRLAERGQIDRVGGAGYLLELANSSPTLHSVRAYGEAVLERWREREAINVARTIIAQAQDDRVSDTQSFLDAATASLSSIQRRSAASPLVSATDALRELLTKIHQSALQAGSTSRGVPTGIEELDSIMGGMHPGSKTTVIASTGVGKTIMSVQTARNAAQAGFGVLLFTCGEMSRDEIMGRMLASLAEVDSAKITRARIGEPCLSPADWQRMMGALAGVKRLPLLIDASAGLTPEDVRAKAARAQDTMQAEFGAPLALVIVDYVQKMKGSATHATAKRHEQIEHATQHLKDTAFTLDVAVLELSQAKVIVRGTPELGQASYSQDIERTADNVIHLVCPDPRRKERVVAHLLKQRSGLTTEVDLHAEHMYCRLHATQRGMP